MRTWKTIAVVAAALPLLGFVSPELFAANAPGCCGRGTRWTRPPASKAKAGKPQTRCPVMGGKINKSLFVDAKGYRLYVCCGGCLAPVRKAPGKYLAKIRANGETPTRLTTVKPATIGPTALAVLLLSSLPVVVLDARTGKFDDGRRIPGAKSLRPDATADQAAAVIPNKNALVITYCAGVKCPASRRLAERLKALGYRNVLEMPEGISGWAAAGFAVEEAAKAAK